MRRVLTSLIIGLVSNLVRAEDSMSREVESTMRPVYLRCEYYVDPVGIDVPTPELSWVLEAEPAEARGKRQTAYQILVAGSAETLGEDRGDLWDTGRAESDRTAHVKYAGEPLKRRQDCHWKVRVWDEAGNVSDWSRPARWVMGVVAPDAWSAPAIGYDGTPAVKAEPVPGWKRELDLPPPPYLRRTFVVGKPVRRAILHAACWGLCKLYLNGERIGEHDLRTGWCDYRYRCYYDSHEVAGLLQAGTNAIGALLGDGWFAGYVGGGRQQHERKQEPHLSLQLYIEYADGTEETIVTDGSWKATYGPILESDLQMGETYDARLELGDWAAPGFDDSGWSPVSVREVGEGRISAYPGSPAKKTEELVPVDIAEPQPGVFVFDLGQNMVGWVRLKLKGETGTTVQLRFAEVVNPDGTLYTANLRNARCIDRYTLKGGGEEVWEPSFTFRGFRYVEVTGYPGRPGAEAITGVVVHADAPFTSSFECSNPMLNRLHQNIVWGQRGNYLEVPTDCPQRDERLGWTGDAQAFIRTAAYNMDIAPFYRKWLVDLWDTQSEEGAFAKVAPDGTGHEDSPAWTDAAIICPYTIYQVYGDTRIIERHYEGMKRYLEFVKRGCDNLIRPEIGYGDWVSVGAGTRKDVIATAYFARMAGMLAEMAVAIGRTEDAEAYQSLQAEIRKAFGAKFVDRHGAVASDSQTAYALAFAYDLLPEDRKPGALLHFLRQLQYRSWHLSTGFVGTAALLPALTRAGKTDVAYHLLTNETCPSWGYTIKHGATTIWERWDGWTEEFGFQTPSMNSFNHYAFGAVGEWMFGTILGIETEGPGFRELRIRPRPGGDLIWARGHYDSINGRIAVEWRIEGAALHLEVEVPPNTAALVTVPARNGDSVRESGRPPSEAKGLEFVGVEDGAVVFRVGSGRYRFTGKYGTVSN